MIRYRLEDRVARITLNRPDKKNALSPAMVEALLSAATQAMDDEQVRALVLDAEGDVFSAGADLDALQTMQGW
ncbi:MAG: enoyl-CoA hydratase/isomerase family protein, partial [Bacteroidota bacterium]